MTYSIVARDPATGEIGGAVQTRWFAVGATVLWAEPNVGAVATQSFAEIAHGPNGLALLRDGRSAGQALAELVRSDPGEAVRQIGIVDAQGGSAAHTGSRCVHAAGHLTAAALTVQANMMERPTVWHAMLAAYQAADGDLAARLMAALRAAEAEGGDIRGRQSAALVVVPGAPNSQPWDSRFDLRVDDNRSPLDELDRLLRLARGFEAFDHAETAAERGDLAAAVAASTRAHELAPDDDLITLWHALFTMSTGDAPEAFRLFAEASRAEPRAGEHLRRFAAAGHVPGAEAAVEALASRGTKRPDT